MGGHHRRAHSKDKPYQCSKCAKTFTTTARLEHHIARIHELKNCETCPYCGKIYSRLKAHVLTCPVRNPERPKIPCDDETCDKTFLDRSSLKRHMEKHGHYARHQVQYVIQNAYLYGQRYTTSIL